MKQSVFWKKVLIVIVATVVAFTVVPAMKPMTAMAESNEFTNPYITTLGEEHTGYLDKDDVHWYKLEIPSDIRNQTIKLILMPQSDFYEYCRMNIYDSSGICISDYIALSANHSDYFEREIAEHSSADNKTFVKGQTYYLKIYSYNNSDGTYWLNITGDYLKASKLSWNARKGKKNISVNTISDATVNLKANNAIIKDNGKKVKKVTVSSGESGKVKFSLDRKLKKGDRITVTVKKSGYEKKKADLKL